MTQMEKLRKEKGYTQQHMSEKINVSLSCYNMYENKQRKIPSVKAKLIANELGCELNDIFLPSTFTLSDIKV